MCDTVPLGVTGEEAVTQCDTVPLGVTWEEAVTQCDTVPLGVTWEEAVTQCDTVPLGVTGEEAVDGDAARACDDHVLARAEVAQHPGSAGGTGEPGSSFIQRQEPTERHRHPGRSDQSLLWTIWEGGRHPNYEHER
ncbi:hypothetical protein FKM82_030476 [Ascaphus truei]